MRERVGRMIAARRARRRAGSRARRKYADLRRAWLRRNRRAWIIAAVTLVAVWIGTVGLLRLVPGDHSDGSMLLAGALLGIFVMARHSPPSSIANWESGAFGEERTAKKLAELERGRPLRDMAGVVEVLRPGRRVARR